MKIIFILFVFVEQKHHRHQFQTPFLLMHIFCCRMPYTGCAAYKNWKLNGRFSHFYYIFLYVFFLLLFHFSFCSFVDPFYPFRTQDSSLGVVKNYRRILTNERKLQSMIVYCYVFGVGKHFIKCF